MSVGQVLQDDLHINDGYVWEFDHITNPQYER